MLLNIERTDIEKDAKIEESGQPNLIRLKPLSLSNTLSHIMNIPVSANYMTNDDIRKPSQKIVQINENNEKNLEKNYDVYIGNVEFAKVYGKRPINLNDRMIKNVYKKHEKLMIDILNQHISKEDIVDDEPIDLSFSNVVDSRSENDTDLPFIQASKIKEKNIDDSLNELINDNNKFVELVDYERKIEDKVLSSNQEIEKVMTELKEAKEKEESTIKTNESLKIAAINAAKVQQEILRKQTERLNKKIVSLENIHQQNEEKLKQTKTELDFINGNTQTLEMENLDLLKIYNATIEGMEEENTRKIA